MAMDPDRSRQPADAERPSPASRLAEQYEQLWASGRPELDTFLHQAGPVSLPELAAVLRTDQRERWRAGDGVPVERYLQRLPGPRPDPEVAIDLAVHEFLLREELGDRQDLGTFLRRFPEYAPVLRDRIAQQLDSFLAVPSMPEQRVAIATDPAWCGKPIHTPGALTPGMFGRYAVLRPLGKGGMGTVYLARDTLLDRLVALKVPHFDPTSLPRAIERFHREARAAAALHHPHLCPVFDVGRIAGIEYLTMAYIPGESLAERLHRQGPFSPQDALQLTRQIALALEVAHQAGVIHRDLKPSNILINERGEPVVTDFGLARRVDSGDQRLTESGTVLGTPAYMAPEQVGGGEAGSASDIYSLGVVLHELLTGQLPFQGSVSEVLRKVLTENPQPPSCHRPDLDPHLDRVCLQAMAKDPQARFPSMATFAEALESCLAQLEGTTRTQDIPGTPSPGSRRWPVFLGAVLLVLVLVGGLLLFQMSRPPADSGSPLPPPDPFRVGSVWAGTFRFLPPNQGSGPVVLTIQERTATRFRGEYATEDAYRWEVEGTASEGAIRWSLTRALTEPARKTGATGRAKVTGTYTNQRLEGRYTDHDSQAHMELSRRE